MSRLFGVVHIEFDARVHLCEKDRETQERIAAAAERQAAALEEIDATLKRFNRAAQAHITFGEPTEQEE